MSKEYVLGIELTLKCHCGSSWRVKLPLPMSVETFLKTTQKASVCPRCGSKEKIAVLKGDKYRGALEELRQRNDTSADLMPRRRYQDRGLSVGNERGIKRIKATKLDILEFIKRHAVIERWQLREHFGFTDSYVSKRLTLLKDQSLVINMTIGKWELTEEGYRKLRFYRKG